MSTDTLLVELFTEELPPKALKKLGDAFALSIQQGLSKRGLLEAGATVVMFATPRRLAAQITNVVHVGADEAFTEKLMPASVGLDKDGNATPALQKKLAAKSLGHLQPKDLLRESDGKVDQLIYRGVAKGQSLQVALQSALAEAIAALPVPKVMSYQLADGFTTVQFVRPAHGLVAIHGANVVPIHALGLEAGRTTHGHRFQGASEVELAKAGDYAVRLVLATHPKTDTASAVSNQYLRFGSSPRGGQCLILGGKVRALTQGRFNVSFEDIQAVAAATLRHRLILNFEAEAEGITTDHIITQILKDVPKNAEAVKV